MNTALETGLHTRAIRDLIETAKNTLEEGKNYAGSSRITTGCNYYY